MKAIAQQFDNCTMYDVELTPDDVLAPCPFCGGDPALAHTWTAAYSIECQGCGAEVSGEYGGDLLSVEQPDYNEEAHLAGARSAVDAWNVRELETGGFDLVAHLYRQRAFSERTFGPDQKPAAVLDHIRRELAEIEGSPRDVTEWIDVVLLALDGAWRAGHSPEEIAQALAAKQATNEARKWPDWRAVEPGKAIQHIETDGGER